MAMKDQFIAAHEELVEEMMQEHPEVTWAQAYELTADKAYDRMRDRLFDKADNLRKKMKGE